MSLSLATATTPNLAPQGPLMGAMQGAQADRSIQIRADWFLSEKRRLEGEDIMVWDNQSLIWAMSFSFIEGRHLLRRAKYGGGWRPAPLPERTDTPVYGYNLVGFYAENSRAKWSGSNTDIAWRPSSDADQAQGSAKAAQKAHDHYKRKLYTNQFKQLEAMLALGGKYARYIRYSDEVKGKARRPRIEQQQMQMGETTGFCADCGWSGPLASGSGDMAGAMASGAAAQLQPDSVPGDVQGAGNGSAYPPDAGPAAGAQLAQPFTGQEMPSEEDAEQVIQRQNPEAYQQGEAIEHGQTATMVQPGALSTGSGGMEGSSMGTAPSDLLGAAPSMEGHATCPECGSPNLEIQPAESFPVEAVTGYDEIDTGDMVCETVPAFELKHDLQKDPHESPYLIRRRRVRTAILQSTFPFLDIKTAKGDSWAMRMEDSLKKATFTAGSSGTWLKDNNDEQSTDFVQIWLDPCLYSRNILNENLTTLSGDTISAGTKLIDLFPTGLYMCFVEGIDAVIELRDEHHKDYWVGSVLRPRAISSLGCGIEDMIEGNRQYNLIMSIIYTQLRTAAMPATLYDARLLPNGVSAYLGSLSNIPVELANLDDRLRLSDAVYQLQPQPPTQQHFGYAQQLDFYMQKASRVTDFSGGLPGVNNSTATGAQITSANAQSLFGPQLALKAEVDRVSAEIILKLFKTHCIDEVYVSLSGKRGEQDGVWLKSADINVDLFAEVVGDSYLPQTNLERRERWDGFLQRVGGLPGLQQAMQQFPDQVEQLAEIFDVDLAGEDYTAAAEMCRERIDQMAQALPMLQVAQANMPAVQMGADPMTGQMVPMPVDPMAEAGQFLMGIFQPQPMIEELGHMSSIQYLREWLTTDEGKKAPQEQREGVKALLYFHLQGLMAEAQFTGMLGMMGQPPQGPPPDQEGGKEKPKTTDKKNSSPDGKQAGGSGGSAQPRPKPMGQPPAPGMMG